MGWHLAPISLQWIHNFIEKTVEAGVKAIHALTESSRSWDASRKQIVKWAAEGAGKMQVQSILQREGIRQLPKICWYLKSARLAVKQGGTADKVLFVLGMIVPRAFFIGGCNEIVQSDQTMVRITPKARQATKQILTYINFGGKQNDSQRRRFWNLF